jgi:CrcB protein
MATDQATAPVDAEALLARRRLRFELRELLLVAAGAVPGALLRWQAAVQLGPWIGGNAGADLLVNLVGSFVLGFLAGPIPRRTSLVLWLGIGFCGCLTTFSSWMLDVVHLIETGQLWGALALVLGSLVFGLATAAVGLVCSRRLFRRVRGA